MANLIMESDVHQLCRPYRRRTNNRSHRWGHQKKTIRSKGGYLKVTVQRVIDKETNKARPLATYQVFNSPRAKNDEMLHETLLMGWSQREYKKAVNGCCKGLGLSKSTVGRPVG